MGIQNDIFRVSFFSRLPANRGIVHHISCEIFRKQAGAELCQAQSSLQHDLATHKLSSLQINSSKPKGNGWLSVDFAF